MRTPIIAGNWKMNNTLNESVSLVRTIKNLVKNVREVEIVVFPPFTSLKDVCIETKGSNLKIGAQNLFYEEKGAYTGEISALMLKELCKYVLVGHSERRQYFKETDEMINKKIKTALKNNITPVFCVGETLNERNMNKTKAVVENQIKEGLKGILSNDMQNLIIAYEPVWAIGTGKTASPEQAEEVHLFIRSLISKDCGKKISDNIRILYGGSVKPDNTNLLMEQIDIDGALVGGASLEAESFSKIVNFANKKSGYNPE